MLRTNGVPAAGELAAVPGGFLAPEAARSWTALVKRVKAETGWTPEPTGPFDSFRPKPVQVSTFLDRYRTTWARVWVPALQTYVVDRRVWNGTPYWRFQGAAAAVPGTSNHGWGVAIDVADIGTFASTRHKWLTKLGPAYGWDNDEGAPIGEPWHWRYRPGNDTRPYDTAPVAVTPEPAPLPEEDDVPVIIQRRTVEGAKTLLIGGGWRGPLGRYSEQAIREVYPDIETRVLSEQDYDTMLALLPALDPGDLVRRFVAALPPQPAGGLSRADAEQAIRAVLGSLDEQ